MGRLASERLMIAATAALVMIVQWAEAEEAATKPKSPSIKDAQGTATGPKSPSPKDAQGGAARRNSLSRKETVALFSRLAEAGKTSRTFQAALRRTEQSGFVIDAKPLESRGAIWVQRPSCLAQEIRSPKKELVVMNEKHVWVYYPEAREVQHVDLAKRSKGRSGSKDEFFSWLSFNLEELEKSFRVRVSTDVPPKGVTIRKVKPTPDDAPAAKKPGPAAVPATSYRIDLVPRDPKLTPDIVPLSIWVDGENPWPLMIEQENPDGDVITSRFTDIVLDAPVEPSRFRFKRPRRTKVVELSE